MRESRVNLPNRCYHLISRVAGLPAHDIGHREREYFTKAYLRPLTEAGLIARTDPDHPNSPRQKYALTKAGSERIRKVAPL